MRFIFTLRAPVWAVLWLLPSTTWAGVSVTPNGDRLDLSADATPISEVLDRLAQHTGMKVVYDGAPPRQAITLSLRQRTPAEAVLDALQGLGLNYALLLDVDGQRVDTLLITGTNSPGSQQAAASARPASPPRPPKKPATRARHQPKRARPTAPPQQPAARPAPDLPLGYRTPSGNSSVPFSQSPFAPQAQPDNQDRRRKKNERQ